MKKLFLSFAILSLLLIPLITSAGTGSLYTTNNPLQMHYGETKTIDIQLSNKETDQANTFELEIIEGSDIVSLDKTTYTVDADSELIIPLTISVPNDYSKDVQPVKIETKTTAPDQGGMVSLGTASTISFDILLSQSVEEPVDIASSSTILIILVIAVIIIALIIFFVMRRR